MDFDSLVYNEEGRSQEVSSSLPSLEGTPYQAKVTREPDKSYTVEVVRPFRDGETTMFHAVYGRVPTGDETVGFATLSPTANLAALNRAVERIIEQDSPSLVGVYSATEEEGEE